MKTNSKLEKILKTGSLTVTSECGPPRGAVPEKIQEKADQGKQVKLKRFIHARAGQRKKYILSGLIAAAAVVTAILLPSLFLSPDVQPYTVISWKGRPKIHTQSKIDAPVKNKQFYKLYLRITVNRIRARILLDYSVKKDQFITAPKTEYHHILYSGFRASARYKGQC